MKIIEQFIQGKIDEKQCEDCLVINNHYIAIIDGVTSKSDFLYKGETTGKICASIVRCVLNTIHEDCGISEIINEVNKEINQFYTMVNFPYTIKEKGLQAAAIIYSIKRKTIWMIGDCQLKVDDSTITNPKKSDDVLSEMRSLVLHIQKKCNLFNPQEARSIIEPWIIKGGLFANDETTEYGYSVFNGEEIPLSLIKQIKVNDNQYIIMTSDGYPEIKYDLNSTEEYLKEIIQKDALCYQQYKSTKGVSNGQVSFDDRAYISFIV